MPHSKESPGRSYRPGNDTKKHPIGIRTAHPEKLSLEDGPKVVPPPSEVLKGHVGKREPGKFSHKGKGGKKST